MPDASSRSTLRAPLVELYSAAVRAAAPGPALAAALDELGRESADVTARPVWLVALGKAAHQMARAAVEWLRARGAEPAGGVVVAPTAEKAPHPALEVVVGDHPEPGPGSLAAAVHLDALVGRVRRDDDVWVLLSGGASSLAAAPVPGVEPPDLAALWTLLLCSGLDVAAMNTVRKRVTRWGAGRLGVALGGAARARQFVVSDVVGDDVAAIGSGPCVPDPTRAAEVRALLAGAGLWERVPASVRRQLAAAERDPALETPKPGHPALARIGTRIVASNRAALDATAARATALGVPARVAGSALAGEAREAGRALAAALLAERAGGRGCVIWGGETTVTLPASCDGRGGRCQELALAAARELAAAGAGPAVALLAAGTDGRDGPTDAAGAVVDGDTWETIRRRGRDPAHDLAAHDSYPALDAAGALLRTGATGTNVMDVVVGGWG